MAARVFTVSIPAWSRDHMAALLATALGLTGVQAYGSATEITVDHPSLTSAHDAACAAVFSGYVFNPLYGVPAEVLALRGVVSTLRTWATQADTASTSQAAMESGLTSVLANWDAQTTAQRFVTLKAVLASLQTFVGQQAITTTRLGVLCSRLADSLTVHGDN